MKNGNDAIEVARENYLEEARLAAQMLDHAAKLKYPRYRSQLEEVARGEAAHATLLKNWMEKKGAAVPSQTPLLKGGRNDWERLRQDYEDHLWLAEKYLHDAYKVDSEDPELAQLFLGIRSQERDHRNILLRLVMRHDCYDS